MHTHFPYHDIFFLFSLFVSWTLEKNVFIFLQLLQSQQQNRLKMSQWPALPPQPLPFLLLRRLQQPRKAVEVVMEEQGYPWWMILVVLCKLSLGCSVLMRVVIRVVVLVLPLEDYPQPLCPLFWIRLLSRPCFKEMEKKVHLFELRCYLCYLLVNKT